MKGMQELKETLDSLTSNKKFTPTNLQFIYYLFWERGMSKNELDTLPIPYIFEMVNTHLYVKEQEQKAHKRGNKR
jgi:hypothetical protein